MTKIVRRYAVAYGSPWRSVLQDKKCSPTSSPRIVSYRSPVAYRKGPSALRAPRPRHRSRATCRYFSNSWQQPSKPSKPPLLAKSIQSPRRRRRPSGAPGDSPTLTGSNGVFPSPPLNYFKSVASTNFATGAGAPVYPKCPQSPAARGSGVGREACCAPLSAGTTNTLTLSASDRASTAMLLAAAAAASTSAAFC